MLNSLNRINIPYKVALFVICSILGSLMATNILVSFSDFDKGFANGTFCTDILNYMTGALTLKNGDVENLYDLGTQLKYQKQIPFDQGCWTQLPFRALPITTLIYLPLTYVSYVTATNIFILVNLLLLLVTCVVLSNATKLDTKLVILVVFSFVPAFVPIYQGQISLLMTLIISLACLAIVKQRPYVIGMLIVLLLLKPHFFIPGAFLFFSLVKDKTRYIKGLGISLAFFVLINLQIAGISTFLKYPHFIVSTESVEYGTSIDSGFYSIQPIISKILGDTHLSSNLIINLVLLITIAVLLDKLRIQGACENCLVTLGVLGVTLFGYHVFISDTAMIIPAIVFSIKLIGEVFKGNRVIMLLTGLFLNSTLTMLIYARFQGLSTIYFLLFCILWVTSLFVLDRKCKTKVINV